MRDEILRAKLGHLLGRLTPPQSMRGNQQAQEDEMRSLLRGVQTAAPAEDIENWWRAFEDALLDAQQTRAWPTRFEIRKAADAIRPARLVGDDEFENQVNRARAWLGERRGPPPGMGNPRVTAALLSEGRFHNEREARFWGWPLDDAAMKRALAQPIGADEWRHHVRVMASLKGQSEAETEAQERAWLAEQGA
jgi:outer membrane protein TolC